MTSQLKTWQVSCWHEKSVDDMTSQLITWQVSCWHDKSVVDMKSQLKTWQVSWWHDKSVDDVTSQLLTRQVSRWHDKSVDDITSQLMPWQVSWLHGMCQLMKWQSVDMTSHCFTVATGKSVLYVSLEVTKYQVTHWHDHPIDNIHSLAITWGSTDDVGSQLKREVLLFEWQVSWT